MKEKEVLALMDDILFFKRFTASEKEALARESHINHFKKGDYFIRQGDKDLTIFILLKGELSITKDEAPKTELNVLKAVAFFGELPLITGQRWSTNIYNQQS